MSHCNPDVSVQDIIEDLGSVLEQFRLIAALEARLAKTRALKQGMMHELLTGKTRLI